MEQNYSNIIEKFLTESGQTSYSIAKKTGCSVSLISRYMGKSGKNTSDIKNMTLGTAELIYPIAKKWMDSQK